MVSNAIELALQKHLRQLEETLWVSETRFNVSLMEQTFADDCYEVGRSGKIYDRQQLLNAAKQHIDAEIPLPDFTVKLLASDVAMVRYQSIVTAADVVERAHRISIWSKQNGQWRLRFHQGTPFRPN